MDCHEFLAQMAELLDGDMAAPAADAFDRHRQACAHCRTALATVEQMRRLYADERFFAMPEGASERLRQSPRIPHHAIYLLLNGARVGRREVLRPLVYVRDGCLCSILAR